MALSIFREAPLPDGTPGPVSLRRVLAAFFASCAVVLFFRALQTPVGWYVFIPGAVCVLSCLLLLFFTTWADVAAVVTAAKVGQ